MSIYTSIGNENYVNLMNYSLCAEKVQGMAKAMQEFKSGKGSPNSNKERMTMDKRRNKGVNVGQFEVVENGQNGQNVNCGNFGNGNSNYGGFNGNGNNTMNNSNMNQNMNMNGNSQGFGNFGSQGFQNNGCFGQGMNSYR